MVLGQDIGPPFGGFGQILMASLTFSPPTCCTISSNLAPVLYSGALLMRALTSSTPAPSPAWSSSAWTTKSEMSRPWNLSFIFMKTKVSQLVFAPKAICQIGGGILLPRVLLDPSPKIREDEDLEASLMSSPASRRRRKRSLDSRGGFRCRCSCDRHSLHNKL